MQGQPCASKGYGHDMGGKGRGEEGRERGGEKERKRRRKEMTEEERRAHHQEQAQWARDCRASTYKHPFCNQRHYSMDINPICVSLCYNILEQPVQQQPCRLYLGVRVCCLQARCNVIRRAQLSRKREQQATTCVSVLEQILGWKGVAELSDWPALSTRQRSR